MESIPDIQKGSRGKERNVFTIMGTHDDTFISRAVFEVLTAVPMNISILWDITLRAPLKIH
jgi:hypothetical protein